MVSSGALTLSRGDLLRFDGPRFDLGHPDRDESVSNADCETNAISPDSIKKCSRNLTADHNLCVRNGFACGTDLKIPPAIENKNSGCLVKFPSADPAWSFINSKTCAPYRDAPPFYVVLFQRPCLSSQELCYGTWGFFEVVEQSDPPNGLPFQEFMTQTIARNPLALYPAASSMVGEYNSWRSGKITYEPLAHHSDSDHYGVRAINNIEEGDIDGWKLAQGDAISADGEGHIEIRAPSRKVPPVGYKSAIRIDFSDWENPKYEEIP